MIQVLYTDIRSADMSQYRALYDIASEARKQRAGRCISQEAALRCLAAGALLRYAVGTDNFSLETDPMGKPRLRNREDFHFNLSHSGSWVVIAFGSSSVGIDVETRSWNESSEKVVKRFFSPEEQAFVWETEQDRRDRFLRIWTAKESYLKFLGMGLRCPLQSFSVLSEELREGFSASRLPDGAWITLYAQDRETAFQSIDLQRLTEAF